MSLEVGSGGDSDGQLASSWVLRLASESDSSSDRLKGAPWDPRLGWEWARGWATTLEEPREERWEETSAQAKEGSLEAPLARSSEVGSGGD